MVLALRDAVLEHGYEATTMSEVARRAGASKETLYAWFGSKEGLAAALIRSEGEASVGAVRRALSGPQGSGAEVRERLQSYATGLLTLLTSPVSVALNRAAMGRPDLAALLLEHGRHRIGPLVTEYLAALSTAGQIEVSDPASAFELLYGLVVRDTQIRVLLGEAAPSDSFLRKRAVEAVNIFLRLNSVE